MTLSEKILSLRTARGLSQGELAEKLEVSRQSVSKWETGQSTPDLDKIIKLADLFGVTVDELVREGEVPKPEPKPTEPQIVYVERNSRSGLTVVQILGIILELLGGAMLLLGMAGQTEEWLLLSLLPIITGLPLLLAKRRPLLISGWMLVAASYLVLNPWTSGLGLRFAVYHLRRGYLNWIVYASLARFAALIFMLVYTCCTMHKNKLAKGGG